MAMKDTMAMKALFLNCTLKKSPRVSSTQAPINRSTAVFKELDVESQVIKVIDSNIAFGVSSDEGEGNEYSPGKIKACNIPVIATPSLYEYSPLSRRRQLRGRIGLTWKDTPKPVSIP